MSKICLFKFDLDREQMDNTPHASEGLPSLLLSGIQHYHIENDNFKIITHQLWIKPLSSAAARSQTF